MAKAKTKDKDKPKRPEGPRARNDAYVMMLFITLLAIAGGTALMYLDYDEYGQKTPPAVSVPSASKLGEGTKEPPPPTGGVTPPAGGGEPKGGMPPMPGMPPMMPPAP